MILIKKNVWIKNNITALIHQALFCSLLPINCTLCGIFTCNLQNTCAACQRDLPTLPNHCLQCSVFLQSADICGKCLTDPPAFDRTYTLFPYEFPIIHLITTLKFHGELANAQALGELLAAKVTSVWYSHRSLPDVLVPVPLHVSRLRERGFNQALEIARPLVKQLRIPIDTHGIKRLKATAAQSLLPADQRKKNMANAFLCLKNYSGLRVAIVDDVMTTGHTVRELARVIRAAGASQIDIWCCTRRG